MKKILLSAFLMLSAVLSAQQNCGSAVEITANGTVTAPAITGTYVISCDQTNVDGAGPYAGVWYKYTPTSNGTIAISSNLPSNVAPSSVDTRLSVWQGASCSALTCVGGSDDVSATVFLSTFNFNAVAGTTYYFQWDSRWSALGFNFTFNFTPVSCFPVTTVNLPTAISTTSITLNWAEASLNPANYNVEYGPLGFTLGTGTLVSTPTNSLTLNGLTASTSYDYYVRSNCGTSQSTWTTVNSFSTAKLCPQSFGFENNGELVGWSTLGNGSYGLSANAPTLAQAGNFYWIFNTNATAVSNNWLFTPAFSLQANEAVTITFWVRCATARSLRLTVGNSTVPATQTTQLWANAALNNPTFTQFSATFTPSTAGIYYFGWNDISTAQAVATLRLDSINFSSVLSTNEFSDSKFTVYPNPTKGLVDISNDADASISSIELSDINGRVVKNIIFNDNQTQIDISQLSQGMYLMKIVSDKGIAVKKIVKE
ncbi:T9SS type A sorting domain-containing protein [Flavobacterium sp.]|uniref:T9SS type A sorting domain-containing protein n=1 Tax=Flavobacterium sp. TaxID=239 RepID=UPI0037BF13DE